VPDRPMLSQALALVAYAGVMRLLTPFFLVKLWSRGRREPLYRQAWRERLGWYAPEAGRPLRLQGSSQAAVSASDHLAGGRLAHSDAGPRVWVHAVSLGETRAAAALIQALRRVIPGMRLLLTHGTATGREAGVSLLAPGDRQVWVPFDTPGATRRFLAQFRPALGVLMETEIWPQLLAQARRAGVPMVLANARLSERSLRQGQRLDSLMRPAAASLTLTLAQTEADAQRLQQAGVGGLHVCGNLKFDMTPRPDQVDAGRLWRQALGRAVVLAASTREGEEEPLLQAWQQACAERLGSDSRRWPLLLLVPRHPQRFDEVAARVDASGLRLARRSADWTSPGGDGAANSDLAADVMLGDSLGEMALYCSAGDVALLGGSFAPLGGQNLIEAAACGCPVIVGPHTFNFEQATEWALSARAAWRVGDLAAGVHLALGLLAGEAVSGPLQQASVPLAQARENALAFAGAHRGAADRMARKIAELQALSNGGPVVGPAGA
jgi:3-deoxy-D-manno-octulosonic-acid transferase